MASAMPSSAETSLRLGTCFVNGESATAEGATVHGFNGLLCLLRRSHGDKTKSSGTPADPVNHQIRFHYGAVRCKSVVQFIFRCVKREVSNKQLRVHVMYYMLYSNYRCDFQTVPDRRVSDHHRTEFA